MRVWCIGLIMVLVTAGLAGTPLAALPSDDPLPQDDHHSGRDAPDTCAPAEPWIPTHRGSVVKGELRPMLDEADFFGLEAEGGELFLHIQAHPAAPEEGSRLVGDLDPLYVQVLDERCVLHREERIHGVGGFNLTIPGGLHFLGILRGAEDPFEGGLQPTGGPVQFCHPPCAAVGYRMTIE